MAIIGNTSISVPAALYSDIRDAIYAYTNRPDLVSETAAAIRKATMKIHMAELWKNDLTEIVYQLEPAAVGLVTPRYTIDLTDQVRFLRYRRVSHIKEYNATATGAELNLVELDADRVFDEYQAECVNYWYQAGQQISLRTDRYLTNLRVGFYRYPNVLPAQYDSWIARQFPDAIIDEATAQIFKVIGKDSEYQRLAQAFADNFHMLQTTQV